MKNPEAGFAPGLVLLGAMGCSYSSSSSSSSAAWALMQRIMGLVCEGNPSKNPYSKSDSIEDSRGFAGISLCHSACVY
jgi:hypothetical protein